MNRRGFLAGLLATAALPWAPLRAHRRRRLELPVTVTLPARPDFLGDLDIATALGRAAAEREREIVWNLIKGAT